MRVFKGGSALVLAAGLAGCGTNSFETNVLPGYDGQPKRMVVVLGIGTTLTRALGEGYEEQLRRELGKALAACDVRSEFVVIKSDKTLDLGTPNTKVLGDSESLKALQPEYRLNLFESTYNMRAKSVTKVTYLIELQDLARQTYVWKAKLETPVAGTLDHWKAMPRDLVARMAPDKVLKGCGGGS